MAKISASLRIGSSSSAVDNDSAKKMADTSQSFTNSSPGELIRLTGSASFNTGTNKYTTVKVAVEEGGPVVITKIELESTAGTFTIWNSSSGQQISSDFHFKGNNPRSTSGTITAVKIYGYDASGGSGGGGGSDDPEESKLVVNSFMFPSSSIIDENNVSVYFNAEVFGCYDAWVKLYDEYNNREEIYQFTMNGDYGYIDKYCQYPFNDVYKVSLRAEIYYQKINELIPTIEFIPDFDTVYTYERKPNKLSNISFTKYPSKNLVKLGEKYKLEWSSSQAGGNKVARYVCIFNGTDVMDAGKNRYLESIENMGEKGKAFWQVKAIAEIDSPELDSGLSAPLNIYTYKSGAIQNNIISTNADLFSGSATFNWEPMTVIVHDDIKNKFSVKYNLKYRLSDDKENWGDIQNLATGLISPSYTISEIGEYNFNNKFVLFIIESEIYYDGDSTPYEKFITEPLDGFIKYSGNKPNQLASIIFENIDLKNNRYFSNYVYDGVNYIWETFNTNYITKNSTLTINFGELASGFTAPGVKITWEKGSIKKSKEFYENNNNSTKVMTIIFEEDDFFDSDFWNEADNLILTITSLGYKHISDSLGFTVLEEQRGYFYKGLDIKIIKTPIINLDFEVSPNTKNIFVNFDNNNKEPVMDVENNIYEDIIVKNIKATHPQGIDIYGYKVYASAYINNNWKAFIPVIDDVLSASNGGTYSQQSGQEGWFIPAWKYDIGDGSSTPIENNDVNLKLNILNPEKNTHLSSLLGSDISTYAEKLNVEYRIKAIDSYGQESNNYFSYNFVYDCRKPAIFEVAPSVNSSSLEIRTIAPYGDSIATIPVFNDDKLIVKFYPAINERHYVKNTSQYVTFDNKTYLKFTNDNSIVDPNYYSVYKFIKQPSGELKSYLIDLVQPFLNNSSVLKKSENINGESVLYYLYQLNFDLNDKNIDEVAYYQIVPFYEETNEVRRSSRIYCYEDNRNKFNISYGNNSAIFWNSRLDIIPKVQITGIERIATTKDEFGFKLPKLKLYITDWGTTHQFVGGNKLEKKDLLPYNRLTELNYSIKFYKEVADAEGNISEVYLPELDWNRTYLPDNEYDITYDILAQEYGYSKFEELYNSMDEEYQITYSDYSGSDEVPAPSTGSTVYINLKSPIIDANENSTNFLAKLDINGKVLRVSVDTSNENEIVEQELELSDYSIYISQNKKTFMIQQGKLGINQPELDEVEESLYIIDKKNTNKDNDSYPNILGLEMSRNFNKINDLAGAFIGFYDDSTMNDGNRILMGSIGLAVDYDDFGKATNYTPYVVYNEFDEEGNLNLTSLNLIPEAGDYVEIEEHRISHARPGINENVSLLKIAYDDFGHVTGSQEATRDDIRNIARITYGTTEPLVDGAQEGDIYLWVQSE